jgi:[acyl-carrier-protein] S-malonyltransferase
VTPRPGYSAPGAERGDVPAGAGEPVATVDGRPITAADVDLRLAQLRAGPRARHIPPDGAGGSGTVRRWIVQELVTEAVLAHEARAAGIADIAEPGRLSPTDVARLVARVTPEVTVPEADARAYYDRNQDLYQRPEAGPAFVVPFADVRAAIEEDLLVAARARVFDEWLERRRQALVVIEPGFEHPGHPVHGVPSHRH